MRRVKLALNLLFLTVSGLHACAFFYSAHKIAEEKIRLDNLSHPFVLTCLLSLIWIGLVVWARIRTGAAKPEENPDHNSRCVFLGAMAVITSVVLTGFGLELMAYRATTYVLSLIMIAYMCRRTIATMLNAVSIAAHATVFYLFGSTQLAGTVVALGLLILFSTYFLDGLLQDLRKQSTMFNQARWAASEFVNVNIRLQNSVDRTEIVTRSSERTRVAREIHDTVGYTLTALLVQISAAQEILRVDPGKLFSRFERLEKMIRMAISDVRKEVSKLRDEKANVESWRTRWLRLCSTFADCTGIRINTDIAGNLRSVDDIIGTTIYRIIQESLTNAYRHGRANVVDVAMEWQEPEERILLRVSDDGRGSDNPVLGNGLNGIRERIYNLGGEVVLQTKPYKGFDIGITIPWKGEVLDEEDTRSSGGRSSRVS